MPPILTVLPVFECFTYSQRIKTTVFHFKNSRVAPLSFTEASNAANVTSSSTWQRTNALNYILQLPNIAGPLKPSQIAQYRLRQYVFVFGGKELANGRISPLRSLNDGTLTSKNLSLKSA